MQRPSRPLSLELGVQRVRDGVGVWIGLDDGPQLRTLAVQLLDAGQVLLDQFDGSAPPGAEILAETVDRRFLQVERGGGVGFRLRCRGRATGERAAQGQNASGDTGLHQVSAGEAHGISSFSRKAI